jgi:hypothetical protein
MTEKQMKKYEKNWSTLPEYMRMEYLEALEAKYTSKKAPK